MAAARSVRMEPLEAGGGGGLEESNGRKSHHRAYLECEEGVDDQ